MSKMSMICNQLKKAIERDPRSRYRLSKETGIEQSQFSRFMSGKRSLSIESIEIIAKALGFELTMKKRTKKREV